MRHSYSSNYLTSGGQNSNKKVSINVRDVGTPVKENNFKSTYSQDFNNPSSKRQASTSQTQRQMVSMKAKQKSVQRFTSPRETDIYNQILNSPSQIPPAKLIQQRKTQHYYDQHKHQQNKFQSNYQANNRVTTSSVIQNSGNKHQDPYDLKQYQTQISPAKKSSLKNGNDRYEQASKVIEKADKQHHQSDIAVPYETAKIRNQMMNSLSNFNTNSQSFTQLQDQINNTSSNKYLTQFSITQTSDGQPRKGQHRIIDRFVKYPYPNNIGTNYRKDFNKQNGADSNAVMDKEHRKQAFNLEKEHKIINPHQMDLKTTARVDFQPFAVVPQKISGQKGPQQNVPFLEGSIYKSQYQNWGKSEQLIEKTPQYPVYQLPFKGKSQYQEKFTQQSHRQRSDSAYDSSRPESANPQFMARSSSHLKLGAFQPQKFDFETTKQKDYQPFKITQRPQTSKPDVEPVKTHADPKHFETLNKREYKAYENYKPPEVDYMPYP
ncbi:UNKNOWN [Stylonychia lemnae]|uniref:STOP protein n=1 Tax=Stylonychia lemnae TaxID=5949 RepID=A0A077ZU34_STYLE|nr:UNKNOWN [Stylonychia lemnae]|eukprot:CDW73089.1 UNKNOWN [Stylonychia lemnae]